MMRHLSHIFLTLARTFISTLLLRFQATNDAAPGRVRITQFHNHFIAWNQTNDPHLKRATDMGGDQPAAGEPHAIHTIRSEIKN